MKRNYKSKLEKLQATPLKGERFRPTHDDVVKWFRILNREMFNSSLKTIPEIDIRVRRGTHAYFCWTIDTKNRDYVYPKICINKIYASKKQFVEVLAHEMIHYHQVLHNNPPGHGPNFHEWTETFNKKGLRLLELGYEKTICEK